VIIVADSSPLISFAILKKLDILLELFEDILIPNAVFKEISSWHKPFSKELEAFSKQHVKKVQNTIAVSVISKDLDKGESEAIVLALENNIPDILIDDHKGRRIAKINGLYPIGTIGVLIQAKHQGMIEKIKPLLDILIENKIRISNTLYDNALKLSGELN
jgi:predicted nucleic acid-binding protein